MAVIVRAGDIIDFDGIFGGAKHSVYLVAIVGSTAVTSSPFCDGGTSRLP
jgi:hypothetical protein